jgi:uncharacterized membrane protein
MNHTELTTQFKIDSEEFLFQFKSHPNYPSALAFSDTLTFSGIKNDAYNLEKEYWDELPHEFITVYNNNFALIKKEKTLFKLFSEDIKTITKKELYKNSTDLILLFQAEEKSKTKEKYNLKYAVFAILCFVLIYTIVFLKWYETIFNLFSIFGFYISLELFNKKFGQESTVLNNICGGNPAKPQVNCSKIIDSDKINILGLKLSDFSLVYFVAILVLGIALPIMALVLKILSFISIFVILYSLYFQIIVEKAICKICLLIVSVLIFQIAISQIYFKNFFAVNILFIGILVFTIAFISLVFINDVITQKNILSKSNVKNLRFKRNYDLFKRELLDKEKINFKDNLSGFFIGNKNSKLHISVVSNPYCGFCKNAHEILEKLHKQFPDDISFQIRFNYLPKSEDKNLNSLMQKLFIIYSKSEKEFLYALHFWFEKRDLLIFSNTYN